MIKTIIFDLNGIFIQSPKLSERMEREWGVPNNEFLPALKEIMAVIRKPNAGDAYNYWKPYFKKWGIPWTKEEFFEFYFSGEKENTKMTELAKELQLNGIDIFILSNNFVERAHYYINKFTFLQVIPKKVYYSWQTGFVKPNPEAFTNLLQENNLKPQECLFFDDSEDNITVARHLGLEAKKYTTLENLKNDLSEYKLI